MEQRSLGRDLHDDLCQQLAGIEFLTQSLSLRLAGARRAEAAAAAEVNRLVR
ncbi:MAG: histidine kinase [Verrucomicrobiota bacterium]